MFPATRILAFGHLTTLVIAASSNGYGFATTSTDASFAASLTEIPTAAGATYPTDYDISTVSTTSTSTSASVSLNNGTTVSLSATLSSTEQSDRTTATGTVLSGTAKSSSISSHGNATSTSTSSSATATNTQPCNGYVEFCDRKYSNITYVAAHNSPFVVKNNAASNQALDVTTQLNDGIRALQFETHKPNSTSPIMLCHTSCDELNVGPLEDYLVTVRQWLEKNRYEVITILMGNDDYVDPGNYTSAITNSGILDYLYIPSTQPMGLDGWPTLAEMILTNKRVVMMLDYDANQSQVPWLLEQWSYLWQTPFSPTDPLFPCTVQRPPGQPTNVSENRMYVANHNLNVQIDIASLGLDILVPDWTALNNTNANTTAIGAAGTTINNCTATWNRPPNFLLVDYYNIGNFNGSTLAAAAKANGVSYNIDSCCGRGSTSAAIRTLVPYNGFILSMIGVLLAYVLA